MKILTRFIILSFLVFFFDSCGKTPKSSLISADEWLAHTKEPKDVSNLKGIRFTDSAIIVSDNKVYPIKWTDDKTFTLNVNGQDVVVRMREISKDELQAAFLYNSEKFPESDIDWISLQNEDRTIYFTKTNKNVESNKFYKIAGKTVPIDKVPPAGLYLSNGNHGFAINVSIEDGIVKFQTGEDKYSLIEVDVDIAWEGLEPPYISSIYFTNDWGECEYVGNGVLENSGSFFNGNSGGTTKFTKQNSLNDNNEYTTDNLIDDIAQSANDYGYIYKNGKIEGKVVKVLLEGYYPHSMEGGVTELDIPEGKMWTPLYYEQTKGRRDGSHSLEIFYKTNHGYGYYDGLWYRFEVTKEQFVSCKFSKQNSRAFVRKDKVAVIITSWSKYKSRFIFYCLEESI